VLQDAAIRDLFVFLEAAGETIDRGCRPVPPEELQPALEKLAQTYQEQGKVAQARETWRRLAVEFPEDADRYHLQIFRGDVVVGDIVAGMERLVRAGVPADMAAEAVTEAVARAHIEARRRPERPELVVEARAAYATALRLFPSLEADARLLQAQAALGR